MEIQLGPGERIIWSGAPIRHRFFRRQERTAGMYYTVGAVWGSVLLILLRAVANGQLRVEVFAVAVCLLLPAACLLGLAEWSVHRTVNYQVTDRRVIVTWRMRRCVPINRSLRYLAPPSVKVRADGSGTVSFVPPTGAALHLEDIPDAADTHRAIYEAWLHSCYEE